MRTQFIKILCVFSLLTLLFSFSFGSSAANYNDKRFDRYINMGDNAVNNGYKIPHMFRQDAPYGYLSTFPLVVNGGVEYVPLSMFILYPYVEVSYSNFDDNFYLLNTRNNNFVSFNVEQNIAETNNGTVMKLETRIFHRTRYVPARQVAEILGFVCESYDDPAKGIYAFRISNGKSSKTLKDLLTPYLPVPEEKTPEVKPENPPEVKPETPPEVKPFEDPIEKLSPRTLSFCFTGLSYTNMGKIETALSNNNISATFSFTKDEVFSNSDLVRRLFLKGHSLAVTASVDFEAIKSQNPESSGENLEKLYIDTLISGFDESNNAFKTVLKTKTRICTLPNNLPSELMNSTLLKEMLTQSGYLVYTPNFDSTDTPGSNSSAYTISTRIKNRITGGKETDSFNIRSLFTCSDKSVHYITDIAVLINKYRNLNFKPVDEFMLFNNQGV